MSACAEFWGDTVDRHLADLDEGCEQDAEEEDRREELNRRKTLRTQVNVRNMLYRFWMPQSYPQTEEE